MPEPTDPNIKHQGHLGTGNGLIQFVCCSRTEQPFDMLWTAPGGKGAANVFHTPRQAYDAVVRHLSRGHEDDTAFPPAVEAANALVDSNRDTRTGIEYLAEHLDTIDLNVRVQ